MGIAAYGTLLKLGDGAATESFTTIAEVVSIGGPNLSADTADITNHSSTGGWEEVVVTILRSGEVQLEINYNPAGATHDAGTGLLYEYENKALSNYQLVFPDTGTTTWTFAAYVTQFQPNAPVDGKLSASVTLKPSGQPTLA